jgi:NADH:ubiquinone oxidoreductase subunit E
VALLTLALDARIQQSLTLLKYSQMSALRWLPETYAEYISKTLKTALKEVKN